MVKSGSCIESAEPSEDEYKGPGTGLEELEKLEASLEDISVHSKRRHKACRGSPFDKEDRPAAQVLSN